MRFMMGACRAMRREEEDHPKALYRRGTTHALLGNFEEAARDLARSSLPGLTCAVPSDGTVGLQQAYTFLQATRAGPCLGAKWVINCLGCECIDHMRSLSSSPLCEYSRMRCGSACHTQLFSLNGVAGLCRLLTGRKLNTVRLG